MGVVGVLLLYHGIPKSAPPFVPATVVNAVLYDVNPLGQKLMGLKQVTNKAPAQLTGDEVQALFANVRPCGPRIWKGALLANVSCSNGQEYSIAMSYYGGFFRVLDTREMCEFVGPSKQVYETVKAKAFKDVFFPERGNANANAAIDPGKTNE